MGFPARKESTAEASQRLPETKIGPRSTRRSCEWCGEPFTPYRKWQRFCPGGRCRAEAWAAKHPRVEVAPESDPKPRPSPAPESEPDPIVAVMVRALLAAGER